LGRTRHRDFLATYNEIDIGLDPFPYSGGLSTCEALYMGVPVLTRAGGIFAARHPVSHLANTGLTDWIAGNTEDYIAKARNFAAGLPALDDLRAGLRARVTASPLCDAPRFGKNLGAALRRVWINYCEGTAGK
jgi:predicted O-linked N-acetylglucosamine transferase (SPINDLY family)